MVAKGNKEIDRDCGANDTHTGTHRPAQHNNKQRETNENTKAQQEKERRERKQKLYETFGAKIGEARLKRNERLTCTVERTHLAGSLACNFIVSDPYAVRMHVTKLVIEASSVPDRPGVWFFRTI